MNFLRILLIFILFSFFSGCSYDSYFVGSTDDILKIGFIGPQSVPSSSYGLKILEMVNFSINEINNDGGINGKQIQLIPYDGKCSGDDAREAAEKLIFEHGVDIIIGGVCSAETLGIAPLAEVNEVILISPISQSADISNVGEYVFRMTPGSDTTLSRLAQVAYDLGYRKLASISQLTSYTGSERKNFIQTFKKLGGEIVFIDSFLPDDRDISQQFLKLKNSDVDSVLLLSQDNDGFQRMADEMKDIGLSSNDFQIFTNFILTMDGPETDFYNFFQGSYFEDYYISKDSKGYDKIKMIIDQNFGEEFYIGAPLWVLGISYDLPYIIKSSMVGCLNYETECIRDNLYSIRNFDGVFNLEKIDSNGDGVTDSKTFVVGGDEIEFLNFGFIGPLEHETNIYGLRFLDVINLAIGEINLNGGIGGKQVNLIIMDGKCSQEGGYNAAFELIKRHRVKVIFGGICSDETLGAAPLAEENEVILISPSSQSDDISDSGDFVFRNIPSIGNGITKLADKAYELGYRKIASIGEVTGFTNSQRKIFMERFKELGGQIVLVEGYSGGEKNIAIYFDKLNYVDFDAILLLAQSYESYARIEEAIKSVISSDFDFQFFGSTLIGTEKIYKEHFDFYGGSLFPETYVDIESPKSRKLIEKIEKNFDSSTFYLGIPLWGIFSSYDLPYIMKDVIEGCEFYETSCIKDSLYDLNNFSGYFEGFEGFDENGDGILEHNIFIVDSDGIKRFEE